MQARIDVISRRLLSALDAGRTFARTKAGARLAPVYAALLGAAGGALVADRLVRSMWQHALFTGPHQWRTVALALTVIWLVIGAVTALALFGVLIDDPAHDTAEPAQTPLSASPDAS
jgi:hypothetical protein